MYNMLRGKCSSFSYLQQGCTKKTKVLAVWEVSLKLGEAVKLMNGLWLTLHHLTHKPTLLKLTKVQRINELSLAKELLINGPFVNGLMLPTYATYQLSRS